jgi:hypothetical protein
MHANVQRRERQAYGRDGRSDDDSARKNRQLEMNPRQRRGRTGNADRVITGLTGFNPDRFNPDRFNLDRFNTAAVVAMQFVIVVMILDSEYRRVVVMVVAV